MVDSYFNVEINIHKHVRILSCGTYRSVGNKLLALRCRRSEVRIPDWAG